MNAITLKVGHQVKIIGIVSQKGGSGKTQLAQSLGVLANETRGRAAIVDLDPQQSAVKWSLRRGAETPVVLEANSGTLDDVIAAAKEDNIQYLFLDTPPHVGRVVDQVVRKSDIILVPVRPDPANLDAIDGTWGLVSEASNVLAVLNGIPTDTSSDGDDLDEFLRDTCPDMPIAKARLHQRKQFWKPHIEGKAVSELGDNMTTMKAKGEIKSLWAEIKKGLK